MVDLSYTSALLFTHAYSVVPAIQVSATTSGLRYSRAAQLLTGTMTMKNISASALIGPWQTAMTGRRQTPKKLPLTT